MTCHDPMPTRSALDIPAELAAERHASLRDEQDRARTAAFAAKGRAGLAADDPGAVHWIRGGVGRRLVTLGSAIRPGAGRSVEGTSAAANLGPAEPEVDHLAALDDGRGPRTTSMSTSGSASTATRSANRPGRSDPTRSSQPISSAAVSVADRMASAGV